MWLSASTTHSRHFHSWDQAKIKYRQQECFIEYQKQGGVERIKTYFYSVPLYSNEHANGRVEIGWCVSADQLADISTKPLPRVIFTRLRQSLGLAQRSINEHNSTNIRVSVFGKYERKPIETDCQHSVRTGSGCKNTIWRARLYP